MKIGKLIPTLSELDPDIDLVIETPKKQYAGFKLVVCTEVDGGPPKITAILKIEASQRKEKPDGGGKS